MAKIIADHVHWKVAKKLVLGDLLQDYLHPSCILCKKKKFLEAEMIPISEAHCGGVRFERETRNRRVLEAK